MISLFLSVLVSSFCYLRKHYYLQFTSPCFHPNVDLSGNICLDILKQQWSALYDVRAILLSIQSLLGGECL